MQEQLNLQSRYDAPEYGPETEPEDAIKYSHQQKAIRILLCDGKERSALEICQELGLPPTTRVDSRIRDLRKPQYGAWSITCRRCEDGIYRYRLNPPQAR